MSYSLSIGIMMSLVVTVISYIISNIVYINRDIKIDDSEEKELLVPFCCVKDKNEIHDLEDSLVNDIPIKIVKYYNDYFVLFQYQDLYFDIETRNIKEEELIGLIRSIVKEDN